MSVDSHVLIRQRQFKINSTNSVLIGDTMKDKLYKTLRAKGYSKRECGYAFNRWGKNFPISSF